MNFTVIRRSLAALFIAAVAAGLAERSGWGQLQGGEAASEKPAAEASPHPPARNPYGDEPGEATSVSTEPPTGAAEPTTDTGAAGATADQGKAEAAGGEADAASAEGDAASAEGKATSGSPSPYPLPKGEGIESGAGEAGTGGKGEGTDNPAASDSVAADGADGSQVKQVAAEEPAGGEGSRDQPSAAAGSRADGASGAPARPEVETTKYRGIKPGQSSRDELYSAWGAPKQMKKLNGAQQLTFQMEPFDKVVATVIDNTVASIVIYLTQPVPPAGLAAELRLTDVQPVLVADQKGQALGQAYPERGVLFGFATEGQAEQVSQIMLEPIDAEPFLLRAESHVPLRHLKALADVNFALELNPKHDRAHALRARILLAMGELAAAAQAAEQAALLAPMEPDHRITLAKVLTPAADYEKAQELLDDVLHSQSASPWQKAHAHCELGDLLLVVPQRDCAAAIKHHMQAIKLAETVTLDEHTAVRMAAKELLVDAHLAVAYDIAWGNWQDKPRVVAKWIDRAAAIAEEMLTLYKADEELRLRVDVQMLAAWAGVPDAPEPTKSIHAVLSRGKQLIAESRDPVRRARLEWQIGTALYDTLQIEHARGRHAKAEEYGLLAVDYLKGGSKVSRRKPGYPYLMGRLYFRLGAMQAVNHSDHKQALTWYDKAVSLLERPVPPSAEADAGRQGEAFVSMAVSYWELGNRVEAVRLTKQGAKLMEQAVEDGGLDRKALGVPYGNLASMHEVLGDKEQASEFSELASKCEPPEQK